MTSKSRKANVPLTLASLLVETEIPAYRHQPPSSLRPLVTSKQSARKNGTVDLSVLDTMSPLDEVELSVPLHRCVAHEKGVHHTSPVDASCLRRSGPLEICMEHPLEYRECHVDTVISFPTQTVMELKESCSGSLSKGFWWAARNLKSTLTLRKKYFSGNLLHSLPVIEGVERHASISFDYEKVSPPPLWEALQDDTVISASVQMQTWPRSLPCHTTSDGTALVLRPREPRLNGDFLRLACLEMEMRRIGKIEDVSKARFVLAPRKDAPLVARRRLQEL